MEFRLVYDGQLPSSGNASKHPREKHAIRKVFHQQLAELWQKNSLLKLVATRYVTQPKLGTVPSILASEFERCNFRFIPLVNAEFGLVCSLDILFLRRENPGEVITQGGDIDNRMKTLFDALQIPKNCNGISDTPEPHENPFFCLLEDDALITAVSVTTDRLLTLPKEGHRESDVVLVIHVKARAAESLLYGNLRYVQ